VKKNWLKEGNEIILVKSIAFESSYFVGLILCYILENIRIGKLDIKIMSSQLLFLLFTKIIL
jgi:hypothetical protein